MPGEPRRSNRANKGVAPDRYSPYRHAGEMEKRQHFAEQLTDDDSDNTIVESSATNTVGESVPHANPMPADQPTMCDGAYGLSAASSVQSRDESLPAPGQPPPFDRLLKPDQLRSHGLPPTPDPQQSSRLPYDDTKPHQPYASPHHQVLDLKHSTATADHHDCRPVVDVPPPSDQQHHMPRSFGLPSSTPVPPSASARHDQRHQVDAPPPSDRQPHMPRSHGLPSSTLGCSPSSARRDQVLSRESDASASSVQSLNEATEKLADVLDMQRRIQALQREADHYRELNSVYEREREMLSRVSKRISAASGRTSQASSDMPGFETARMPQSSRLSGSLGAVRTPNLPSAPHASNPVGHATTEPAPNTFGHSAATTSCRRQNEQQNLGVPGPHSRCAVGPDTPFPQASAQRYVAPEYVTQPHDSGQWPPHGALVHGSMMVPGAPQYEAWARHGVPHIGAPPPGALPYGMMPYVYGAQQYAAPQYYLPPIGPPPQHAPHHHSQAQYATVPVSQHNATPPITQQHCTSTRDAQPHVEQQPSSMPPVARHYGSTLPNIPYERQTTIQAAPIAAPVTAEPARFSAAASAPLPPAAAYYVATYATGGANRFENQHRYGETHAEQPADRSRAADHPIGRAAPYDEPYQQPVASAIDFRSFSHKRLLDLPQFGGRPDEWPFFICSYEETTRQYNYSDLENMGRLQKALVGEAKARVKGILIRPEHVGRTVETLAKAFGRPELLAESQLHAIRKLPRICEDRPEQLIHFSTTVDGMVSLLDAPATDHLLSNSLLLKELTAKLPTFDQRNWAAVARSIGPNPSIRQFARWLGDVADDVANMEFTMALDSVQPRAREPKQPNRERHVLLNVSSSASSRCTYCQEAHNVVDCEELRCMQPRERLMSIRKRPLCYLCLGEDHLLPGCKLGQQCGVDGCERWHHQLLHLAFSQPADATATLTQGEPSRPTQQQHGQAATGDQSMRANERPPRQKPKPKRTNPKPADSAVPSTIQENLSPGASPPTAVLNCQAGRTKQTLFYRVVPVTLYGPLKSLQTYALLDEGSSVSLIDEDLANELQLDGEVQALNLQFVGGNSAMQQSRKVTVGISGSGQNAARYDIETLQTTKNLALPTQTVDRDEVVRDNPHLADVPFAAFDCARPTVLLGLEHHFLGVPESIKVGPRLRGVTAAQTKLGWVIYGSSGCSSLPGAVVLHARKPDEADGVESDRLEQLHDLVRYHFTTENFGVKATSEPIQSDTDKRALKILESTTKRIGARFETGLLWRADDLKLPDNRSMALRRLQSVEAKMRRDTTYAERYRQEIQSYLDKGYARRLSVEEAATTSPRTWYLPHFTVQNPNKPEKLRLVFDAAATIYNVSLNTSLLPGPDLNVPLTRLLFRFRLGAIGVCADVREMFHQVAVRKEDQDAQRFLWRDGDDSKEPTTYVMSVMTFGSACSPTSAQFVKNANAKEFVDQFPEAAESVQRNHYVDDFVASFRTSDDAQRVTAEVIEVQKRGGFELRGVVSNCAAVRERFGSQLEPRSTVSLQPDDASQKILGMVWKMHEDVFAFNTQFHRVEPAVMDGTRRPTKRQVLSVAMSIFDPFGLLADFLLPSKIILQELWRRGVQWDEPIPEQVHARWQEWRAQVPYTRLTRVARCYSPSIWSAPGLQLHVFADASEDAFAAVAYWRVVGPVGVELAFIAGKVRCAPLKLLSVPRLELQAAVLATRLMLEIRESHEELVVEKTVFWSDSETVLKWLRCDQRRYVPFVAFRVAEVVESAPASWWRWVPTALNVADDATRVKSPIKFNPMSRWLLGPAWLKGDEATWPEQQGRGDPDDAACEELRPKFVGAVTTRGAVDFDRFSEFIRLARCVARVRRFIANVRTKPGSRRCGPIGADELGRATMEICRQVQGAEYRDEVETLAAGRTITPRSTLWTLKPYLDGDGLLRVHGRTDAASDKYLSHAAKRPIIMPPKHQVTALIVRQHHVICAHQLTDAVIASVRTKFWVPNLRSLVKTVRRNCQTCRVLNAAPSTVFQGQLPADRLAAYCRPFTHTGLDYFGPFQVTVGRRREKRWVALFTCLVTRAVHLEVAADLSTDSCLVCLRNLCHLRGVPAIIRCDNGTNFVGARNELQREAGFFDPNVVERELAAKGVQWIFNCPSNPEAGGAWERLVQAVKRVLRVILHEEAPRVETFRALLLEAANVVNSRPLTHIAVEPDDPEPITPNHFLMGGPNEANAPNPSDVEAKTTRRQWHICRGLSRRFWKLFVRDYLPVLTRRSAHYPDGPPLDIGDIVVLCDEQQQRGRWTRGVIVDVARADDGAVRTATVRTASGELRRPATKLAKIDVGPSGGVDVRGAVSPTAART